MNERLLQFIWQFQYFNTYRLATSAGDPVSVKKTGTWNHHQGPDFSAALVRIGNTTWAGNVELHILSSDWYRHRHDGDKHYANIILHVVWEEDMPVYADDGNPVPCIVLNSLVPSHLLERYEQMMKAGSSLPCHTFLPALDHIGWTAWKDSLAAGRLEKKAAHVLSLYAASTNNWEEVCWQMIAANFGMRVNTMLFGAVAQSLPLTLIAKHAGNPTQVEALLMGQANLLAGRFTEKYPLLLQREYAFLCKKYKLQPLALQPAFLRMRPAGFPTVRMAQLAALLIGHKQLFSQIKNITHLADAINIFRVSASEYWNTHYRFDETASSQVKKLGDPMAANILINTVIPLLFTYGLYNGDEALRNRAVQWLQQLPAEHNQITRAWHSYGIANHCALDSQALIELTNHYCTQKRCLDCSVGSKILKC